MKIVVIHRRHLDLSLGEKNNITSLFCAQKDYVTVLQLLVRVHFGMLRDFLERFFKSDFHQFLTETQFEEPHPTNSKYCIFN